MPHTKHARHAPAATVSAYVPAEHAVHADALALEYVPTLHCTHWLEDVAPTAVLYFPALHGLQTLLVVLVHDVLSYVPALHTFTLQSAHTDAPAAPANVPFPHGTHATDPLLYLPAMHCVHTEDCATTTGCG